MKVLRDTPEKLIVEHNPVVLSVLLTLFGMVFVAIGLFTFPLAWWFGSIFLIVGLGIAIGFNMIFTRRTRVSFDRRTGQVTLRRKTFQRTINRTWNLADFDRAAVESTTMDGGTGTRPTLIFSGGMDAGRHPIVRAYASGSGAQNIVTAINAWHSPEG